MPLFIVSSNNLSRVGQKNFAKENQLQQLIENNMEEVFGCRLVASEFHTGGQHAGRIDSLALSEDENPVIIEYRNGLNIFTEKYRFLQLPVVVGVELFAGYSRVVSTMN